MDAQAQATQVSLNLRNDRVAFNRNEELEPGMIDTANREHTHLYITRSIFDPPNISAFLGNMPAFWRSLVSPVLTSYSILGKSPSWKTFAST